MMPTYTCLNNVSIYHNCCLNFSNELFCLNEILFHFKLSTLPIASYSTIFAAKWSKDRQLVTAKRIARGHKDLCYFFHFHFLANEIILKSHNYAT